MDIKINKLAVVSPLGVTVGVEVDGSKFNIVANHTDDLVIVGASNAQARLVIEHSKPPQTYMHGLALMLTEWFPTKPPYLIIEDEDEQEITRMFNIIIPEADLNYLVGKASEIFDILKQHISK